MIKNYDSVALDHMYPQLFGYGHYFKKPKSRYEYDYWIKVVTILIVVFYFIIEIIILFIIKMGFI